MLMKEGLLFIFVIILFNYMNNECQAIKCYSCSDCNDSNQSTWNTITVNKDDQCMRASISVQTFNKGRVIVHRGGSSTCKPYNDIKYSIYCCNATDLCNN